MKGHRFLTLSKPGDHPFVDAQWALKLGMPAGEVRESYFTSTSLECLISFAKAGLGIMNCYDAMGILKESGLKQVLAGLATQSLDFYCVYPAYLESDMQFQNIKAYLLSCFESLRAPKK